MDPLQEQETAQRAIMLALQELGLGPAYFQDYLCVIEMINEHNPRWFVEIPNEEQYARIGKAVLALARCGIRLNMTHHVSKSSN